MITKEMLVAFKKYLDVVTEEMACELIVSDHELELNRKITKWRNILVTISTQINSELSGDTLNTYDVLIKRLDWWH